MRTLRTKAIELAKEVAKKRDNYKCQKNPNHQGQMHIWLK